MARRRNRQTVASMCGRGAATAEHQWVLPSHRVTEDDLARAIRASLFTGFQETELRQAMEISRTMAEAEHRDMARAMAASRALAEEEEALQAALAASKLEYEAPVHEKDSCPAVGIGTTTLSEEAAASEVVVHDSALRRPGRDLLQVAEQRAQQIWAAAEADWFVIADSADDNTDGAWVSAEGDGALLQFSIATPPSSPRATEDDWLVVP